MVPFSSRFLLAFHLEQCVFNFFVAFVLELIMERCVTEQKFTFLEFNFC